MERAAVDRGDGRIDVLLCALRDCAAFTMPSSPALSGRPMMMSPVLPSLTAALCAALLAACAAPRVPADADAARAARGIDAIDAIDTVVVVYAENRAFDTLYGLFPGANGIPGVNPSAIGAVARQRDRDGSVLPVLPPV